MDRIYLGFDPAFLTFHPKTNPKISKENDGVRLNAKTTRKISHRNILNTARP